MSRLRVLREWVYQFRAILLKPKRKQKPFLPGLPEGLEREQIDALCKEHFGENVAAVENQHLSGWKTNGAYRVRIKTRQGSLRHFIFKKALYSLKEIPALANFPAHPGIAEFVILSQTHGPLANYLPTVYLAEEVEPGRLYHYIMDDLAVDYHRTFEQSDILKTVPLLHSLHEALCEWSQTANTQGLLQYGRPFSLALQSYTYTALVHFNEKSPDETVQAVLNHWKEIAEIHADEAFFTQEAVPIHGDSNYTNLHIHKRDPRKLKVVDWEWAGIGAPIMDLVSMLKSEPDRIEALGYQCYIDALPRGEKEKFTPETYKRLYQWSKIERGLLDAGFLAAQYMETTYKANFSLPTAISRSMQRVFVAYQQLSK
jgi:hypothetical protein